MSETALAFLAANLAAAIAVVVVILLRGPARAMFGAGVAYALWLLVPLAPLALLLPTRVIEIAMPAPARSEPVSIAPIPSPTTTSATPGAQLISDAPQASPSITSDIPAQSAVTSSAMPMDWWTIATVLWLAGAITTLAWQLRRQSQFMADARAGFAGPAVAGFVTPRIVTPADFEDRFDAGERQVIIAHETIHIRRNDARVNAMAALLRCLCWFNPAIHIGAHLMRIDQELACDAAVAERFPRARSVYASALLKAELAARPLPLGCYWPARSEHPLTLRIEMLKLPSPARHRRVLGAAALVLLAAGGGFTAWAARPPEERMVDAPHITSAPVLTSAQSPAAGDIQDQPPPAPAASRPTSSASGLTPDEPVWAQPPPGQGWYLVRGTIEKIEFSDKSYNAFVRATNAMNGSGVMKANAGLWKLSATPYWGDRDAVNAQLLGKEVVVRGPRPAGEICIDGCSFQSESVRTSKVTELPALLTTPAFGMADFALSYDPAKQALIQGKVKRVEFGDNFFDVYVETDGWAGNLTQLPQVFQVRSEYRHPRAEMEKLLQPGRYVSVAGWLGKITLEEFYQSPIALYGTDFRLADGKELQPSGKTLIADASRIAPADPDKLPWLPPGFGVNTNVFDLEAPVVIDGTIVRTDADGYWVEVIGFDPASTPGAKKRVTWHVVGELWNKEADVGKRVTTVGYNAKDKTCRPNCLMTGNASYVR